MSMDCPYCGSDHLEYIGIDDDGESIFEIWWCWDCDREIESSYDLLNIQDDENFQTGREDNSQ